MPTTTVDRLKAARRVSAPLVAVATPDQPATIETIRAAVNGSAPLLRWDLLAGLAAVNETGAALRADIIGTDYDPTEGNPAELLKRCVDLPAGAAVLVVNAHLFIDQPPVIQGVANLRDRFKQDRRTLVLLAPAWSSIPPELAGDLVTIDEQLPDAQQLRAILAGLAESAGVELDEQTIGRAVEATAGLHAFQVEQLAAMALTRAGLDVDDLWESKRRQVELTPGLKVYRGAETFEQVGGVPVVKRFLSQLVTGNDRPRAVVFLDEIEKAMAGAGGDTSGVSQDALGTLLSYMQDQHAAGLIFLGPPGSAKSLVAKAAGNVAGVPTIQLDLGACRGSLVGQSEAQLRGALKVVSAVSSGASLWIATCNSINELPPELRRRFTLGTYYFDLPTAEERAEIWPIHLAGYGLDGLDPATVADDGWTGAEIRACCDIARRLGSDLATAAGYVVPVSRSAADRLDALRRLADGRFLSASLPGVYKRRNEQTAPGRRALTTA